MKKELEKIDMGHCGMLEADEGERRNNSSMSSFTQSANKNFLSANYVLSTRARRCSERKILSLSFCISHLGGKE